MYLHTDLCAPVFYCLSPLSHKCSSKLSKWRGESSIRKWFMRLFVHHDTWSTCAPLGPWRMQYLLQGFSHSLHPHPAPPPEILGKRSVPVACTSSPPQKKHLRVTHSGPTLELSTLGGEDIYDVEMACYLFSIHRMWRWFIAVFQTSPFFFPPHKSIQLMSSFSVLFFVWIF